MPSRSPKQARFMRAVAHGWKPTRMPVPPVSVAKDFVAADQKVGGFAAGGGFRVVGHDDQSFQVEGSKGSFKIAKKGLSKQHHDHLLSMCGGGKVKKMAGGGVVEKALGAMKRLARSRMVNETTEVVPGRVTGHLPELPDASRAIRNVFSRDPRASWTNAEGEDLFYKSMGLPQSPATRGSGEFIEKGKTDYNPNVTFHPEVPEGSAGADTSVVDQVNQWRSILDAQAAGAYNAPRANLGSPNGLTVEFPRPLSEAETAKLFRTARASGLTLIDNGGGKFLVSGDYGTMAAPEFAKRGPGFVQRAERSFPAPDVMPVTHEGGYREIQWGPEGSGQVTKAALESTDPALMAKWDANPELLKRIAGRNEMERDFADTFSIGKPRPDLQRLRSILGEGGWAGLRAHVAKYGYAGLPAALAVPGMEEALKEEPQGYAGGGTVASRLKRAAKAFDEFIERIKAGPKPYSNDYPGHHQPKPMVTNPKTGSEVLFDPSLDSSALPPGMVERTYTRVMHPEVGPAREVDFTEVVPVTTSIQEQGSLFPSPRKTEYDILPGGDQVRLLHRSEMPRVRKPLHRDPQTNVPVHFESPEEPAMVRRTRYRNDPFDPMNEVEIVTEVPKPSPVPSTQGEFRATHEPEFSGSAQVRLLHESEMPTTYGPPRRNPKTRQRIQFIDEIPPERREIRYNRPNPLDPSGSPVTFYESADPLPTYSETHQRDLFRGRPRPTGFTVMYDANGNRITGERGGMRQYKIFRPSEAPSNIVAPDRRNPATGSLLTTEAEHVSQPPVYQRQFQNPNTGSRNWMDEPIPDTGHVSAPEQGRLMRRPVTADMADWDTGQLPLQRPSEAPPDLTKSAYDRAGLEGRGHTFDAYRALYTPVPGATFEERTVARLNRARAEKGQAPFYNYEQYVREHNAGRLNHYGLDLRTSVGQGRLEELPQAGGTGYSRMQDAPASPTPSKIQTIGQVEAERDKRYAQMVEQYNDWLRNNFLYGEDPENYVRYTSKGKAIRQAEEQHRMERKKALDQVGLRPAVRSTTGQVDSRGNPLIVVAEGGTHDTLPDWVRKAYDPKGGYRGWKGWEEGFVGINPNTGEYEFFSRFDLDKAREYGVPTMFGGIPAERIPSHLRLSDEALEAAQAAAKAPPPAPLPTGPNPGNIYRTPTWWMENSQGEIVPTPQARRNDALARQARMLPEYARGGPVTPELRALAEKMVRHMAMGGQMPTRLPPGGLSDLGPDDAAMALRDAAAEQRNPILNWMRSETPDTDQALGPEGAAARRVWLAKKMMGLLHGVVGSDNPADYFQPTAMMAPAALGMAKAPAAAAEGAARARMPRVSKPMGPALPPGMPHIAPVDTPPPIPRDWMRDVDLLGPGEPPPEYMGPFQFDVSRKDKAKGLGDLLTGGREPYTLGGEPTPYPVGQFRKTPTGGRQLPFPTTVEESRYVWRHPHAQTKEYLDFFGDSKARHPETNEPLVLQHGTRADFQKVRPEISHAEEAFGFWMAEKPRLSNVVLDWRDEMRQAADVPANRTGHAGRTETRLANAGKFDVPNMMPLTASIQNPLVLPQRQGMIDEVITYLERHGINPTPPQPNARGEITATAFTKAVKGLKEHLRALGHDGILIEDDFGFGRTWVAFDGNQVKSAIGNRGTYSKKTNDVTRALLPVTVGAGAAAAAGEDQ